MSGFPLHLKGRLDRLLAEREPSLRSVATGSGVSLDTVRAVVDGSPERVFRDSTLDLLDAYLDRALEPRIEAPNGTVVGKDWSGRDLAKIDARRLRLENVDFSGAYMSRARFRGATFIRCNFSRADLIGSNFEDATFVDCNLTLRNHDFGRCPT